MASINQTTANQANAKKSTGPTTQQGKAVARFNARRHGLTGQFACMSEGDEIAYAAFEAKLLPAFAPVGAWEIQLAISVIQDQWRLNRARAVETNMFAHGNDMLWDTVNAPTEATHAAVTMVRTWLKDDNYFINIALYATRIQRLVDKNEKRLKALQAERQAAESQAREEAELLTRLALFKGEKLDPKAPVESNGFVFSYPEILNKLNRQQALEEARHHAKLNWEPIKKTAAEPRP